MKKIAILGSTGSIGTQTLQVVQEMKDIQIVALAADKNIDLLEQQIRKFHPTLVGVFDSKAAKQLKERNLNVEIYSGMDGLISCATESGAEIVISAVVGMIGIIPVMKAIEKRKDIALANKETLVTAGHLILPMTKQYGVKLLPIDSEHSAIFQCLEAVCKDQKISEAVSKILLTASGGPFRGKRREELKDITVEQALKHPNWSMGKKITIDSSTMVNKGLEVMEAYWLFGLEPEQIEVVIQPESIIHSAIELIDGAVLAQLGVPDMRLPIQYAITYPERTILSGKRIDFFELGKITFERPNFSELPGLSLAYEAIKQKGSMPTVYNAANECAVEKFLNREIPYLAITDLIEAAMGRHHRIENPSLSQILDTEAETRGWVEIEAKTRYTQEIS